MNDTNEYALKINIFCSVTEIVCMFLVIGPFLDNLNLIWNYHISSAYMTRLSISLDAIHF